MAVLTTQKPTVDGVVVTYAAVAAGGDEVLVSARTFVIVKNGGGAPTTVTLDVLGNTNYNVAMPDKTISVTNATDKMFTLLPDYADPTTGRIKITCSPTTSVTIAAIST